MYSQFTTWKKVNAYHGPNEGFSDYPCMPGNYAIYLGSMTNKAQKLMYIGTAQNLKKRLITHPVKSVLLTLLRNKIIPGYDYVFVKCKIIQKKKNRVCRESRLIKKIQPVVNEVYV